MVSRMRAPENSATGSSGQSFVKAEFEELGWGAVLNPEHDLGTDIWLMARDENRFDLGALVGAQVKTGKSYFDSPSKAADSGEFVGWWYYEEDDSHFDYWSEHTTPHILVLRHPETKTSYWVHVTSHAIQSTGKGNKILVPASQRVDEGSRGDLTSVATSPAKSVSLDGSAWGGSWHVSQTDRLRYALMAPRLVAPHPNRGDIRPDAIEALAMLMQGRFSDLVDVDTSDKRKDAAEVADPDSYVWSVFDATWKWALSGDLSGFINLPQTTDDQHRVASAVLHGAALIEQGRPAAALVALRAVQSRDALDTIDLAWLNSHEARCLVELGQLEEARELALEVQKLRALAPGDPTATALVAVSTLLVFDLTGFGSRSVGELIQSIDTSTRWWRSQTIASGLEKHFDQQFNAWGRDTSITWAAADTVWTNLRSATLLAGTSADHSGWRHTMSLLARRELMRASPTDTDVILDSLTDLIRAGARKELVLATRRLCDDGPVEALVTLIARLDLESSPRSCLRSDLAFLRYAGDLASSADADRHAAWLISSLENPAQLRERLKPLFIVENAMLESLGGLMRSISAGMKRRVIEHLVELPAIKDQSLAIGYGRIVAGVGVNDWSVEDRARLSDRIGDNWELQDDIDAVLAASDPDFRTSLQGRIKRGDLTALGSFGKVTDLPEDVAAAAIEHLASQVEAQIEQALKGMYGMGGPDLGYSLTVLNAWHPEVARWDVVEALLTESTSHPAHILGTLQAIGKVARQLPQRVRASLKPVLEGITQRPAYERDLATAHSNTSPQSSAKLAIMRTFAEEVTDSAMQDLLDGDPDCREVAATLVGERRAAGDQNLLVSLARDGETQVQVAAIVGLAKWLASENTGADLSEKVQALLDVGGPITAKHVSGHLLDMPPSEARSILLQSLADHPSALVRARVAAGLDS